MPHILRLGKYLPHHKAAPVVGVRKVLFAFSCPAPLPRLMDSRRFHLLIMENTGDVVWPFALNGKLKDAPHHRRRFLVNKLNERYDAGIQPRIETGLEIISPDSAHVLYKNMGDLSGLDIGNELFPCRALKISPGPAVIGIVDTVSIPMIGGVAFEVFLLLRDSLPLCW